MSAATNLAPLDLAQHPLSAAFPGMGPLEFSDLKNDIREQGVLQPIILFEGQVLDGWHRYTAAAAVGSACPCTEFAGADPCRFVLSANLNRRHLTDSQKAASVVACNAWVPVGFNQHSGGGEPGAPPATVKGMAEDAGVSERTIQQAKKAHAAGLGEAVREGKVSAKEAAKIADLPAEEREQALAQEKPRAPKPAPKPKADPDACPHCAELREELEELIAGIREGDQHWEEADRILKSDDKLAAAWSEVCRLKEELRVTKERFDALMKEKREVVKDAKRWMKLAQRLEKEIANHKSTGIAV